ncbi:hypothetical protein DFH09DRAFT_1088498 [Mycena vulgaris]|nr:hypothetical protein DFH09DRAFT_1088498 [Mycena vulgaris]
MASVAVLHARINALSLSIAHQKEVLRELEQTKSDAQSELNNILDPARLPLELSSDILLRCLPDKPIPRARLAPLLFLNVCRSWSKIAISTPRLWAAIHLESPFPCDVDEHLDLWLGRASTRPLAISLHGSPDSGVRAAVDKYAHQVQIPELYLRSGDDLADITTPLPSLKTLIIGQRPRDERSFAEGSYADEETYSVGAGECVAMLRAAPGLVDCMLDGIFYAPVFDAYDFGECDDLTHHSLTNLRLNSSALILRYLTLPALESLDVSNTVNIEGDHFPNFLTRSSPPLKSLKIEGAVTWSGGMAERILQLLPNLTDLHMGFWPPQTISTLLEELAVASPTQFLPNLCKITICGFTPNRSQYEKLIATLSARRASHSPIKSFCLKTVNTQPDADIITALNQLVVDGMKIHVMTWSDRDLI